MNITQDIRVESFLVDVPSQRLHLIVATEAVAHVHFVSDDVERRSGRAEI